MVTVQEEILKDDILLICDTSKKADKELAESLEKSRFNLMVRDVTGSEYMRFCEKPYLYHRQSQYLGHEEINKFIARCCPEIDP